jgi:hypothetical protein
LYVEGEIVSTAKAVKNGKGEESIRKKSLKKTSKRREREGCSCGGNSGQYKPYGIRWHLFPSLYKKTSVIWTISRRTSAISHSLHSFL